MAPGNRVLAFLTLGCLLVSAVYLLGGVNWLPWDMRPGSPVGQSMGIAAGFILLAILFYVAVRRSDNSAIAKPFAQTVHSYVGTLGATLAILHSQAALREWSTLVLLAIIGLLVTGIYGRVIAPLRTGAAFGRSAIPYHAVRSPTVSGSALTSMIQTKRGLLKTLSPEGRESEFSLRWHHWTNSPRLAFKYYRLVIAERHLLAADPLSGSSKISPWERYWRRLHVCLGFLFVVGIFAHVVTTVFFAGYVANGRKIYWWYLTSW